MQYNYDAIKDWKQPSNFHILSMCLLALALIIIGLLNFRISSDVGMKIITIYFSIGIGLLLFYVYAIRKGRPFVKRGVYTVTIDNDDLKWSMKLHSESKKIKLSEIKHIYQSKNKIELILNDDTIESLRINQIKNPFKREEFINIMSDLKDVIKT